jgi:crotonobetainyl-CoA:carnitine CoA-transferase CaiB-like acyl-CoA transferase
MFDKSKDNTLTGYSVLDLTDEKGKLCVEILSDMGAHVTRLAPEDKRLRSFVTNTDFLVETSPPGYLKSLGLDYSVLSEHNPQLIMVSITHFGQTGPHKYLESCDLVNQALGGWLSVTGEPSQPLKLFGNQSYNVASLFAVNGIFLALWQMHTTGYGQYLDISILECVAASLDYVLPRYFYDKVVSQRQGSRYWNNAFRIFPCKDGYILLTIHHRWDTLVELVASEGMADDLTDKKWRDRRERDKHLDHVIEVIEKWTLSHHASELEKIGQLMRFPWAQVKGPENE